MDGGAEGRTTRLVYSGLASEHDLQSGWWRSTFVQMEEFQTSFLSREMLFRSLEYPWPHDALHQWSRRWEYPYVYAQLCQHQARTNVVDFGSGVTFFPFFLASRGFRVTAVDSDPIVAADMRRAIEVMQPSHGEVRFALSDGKRIPLADGEADAVYTISVLEHVADLSETVPELARVIRADGGLLVLTVDVGLERGAPMTFEQLMALSVALKRHFELAGPHSSVPLEQIIESGPDHRRLACLGMALRRIGSG